MRRKIDALLLSKMFLAAAASLDANKAYINELNVFPVPDGDTGTNMSLTILSAAKAVQALETIDMRSLSKAISGGSLRGARGNSGVILSQLLRGFCKSIEQLDKVHVSDLAIAFERATETAYKAVMKPKEGTILTVARGMSEKAAELSETTKDLAVFLREVLEHGETVLENTPELLPVLKEAGVVDSGGMGLMIAFKGAVEAFEGKEIDHVPGQNDSVPALRLGAESEEESIRFGYCTEFIILLENEFTEKDEVEFKDFLSMIGDSIVCVADEDIVKIHVHTNDPGIAIQKALSFGQLTRMKIDNMREEHRQRVFSQKEIDAAQEQHDVAKEIAPHKKNGVIAVAPGEGLADMFLTLNVDEIISGGQTMNPSTEDMIQAIEKINADHIYILPNNKNIILAAKQAAQITEDKTIVVIETRTIPQGMSAIMAYDPEGDVSDNTAAMTDAISMVNSGEVTYAVRTTRLDGNWIKKGDYMGIGDSGILASGSNLTDITVRLAQAIAQDRFTLSVYYGAEVTEEEAEAMAECLKDALPECDVLTNYGGQPVYSYLLGAE